MSNTLSGYRYLWPASLAGRSFGTTTVLEVDTQRNRVRVRQGDSASFWMGDTEFRAAISKYDASIPGALAVDAEAQEIWKRGHNAKSGRYPLGTTACLRAGFDATPDRIRRLRTLGAHISKFADTPARTTRDVIPVASGMQRRTESAPIAEHKAPLPAPAVQAKLVNASEAAFEAELQKIKSDLEQPLREKIRKMRTLVQIAENAIPGMVTDSIKKALNMPGGAADTEWSKALKLLNEISAESPRVGG